MLWLRGLFGLVWRSLSGRGGRAPAAPVSAPKPAPAPRRPAAGEQVLWCEPGRHEWTRPTKPGRKPLACPRHS